METIHQAIIVQETSISVTCVVAVVMYVKAKILHTVPVPFTAGGIH